MNTAFCNALIVYRHAAGLTRAALEDQTDIRPGGYGRIWWHGGYHLVHVLMWQLAGHRLRPGCELHHECRNRRCCNPDHLRPVTRSVHRRITQTERRHR